ncbi:uncharacterized protein UDID_05124 [Ustilago sp. UG-2017a]|nr:uncharacterized protein UDID_05124 [Ustilago sp. UG-2017a]
MIAAMRPSHAHSTAPSVHSRPSSRNSSHSNAAALASPSTRSKSDKLAAKAAANVANVLSGKKASAAKKTAKAQQQAEASSINNDKPSTTPGLITLTKPMSDEMNASKQSHGVSRSKKGKEAKFATEEASATPIKASRSKKSKSSPKADTSEMLLSKSAPSAPITHVQRPLRNKQAADSNAVEQSSLGLTWQQEMFKQQASRSNVDLSQNGNGSRRPNKKANAAASKHDGNLAHPQRVQDGRGSPALTWQQELLAVKKRAGPHFDVFADARDVETFGADDGPANGNVHSQSKGGKRGKGANKGRNNDMSHHIDDLFESVNGDGMTKSKLPQSQRNNHAANLHTQYPQHGAPIHIAPSTPVKKPANGGQQQHPAVTAASAYAGPNFHNSPSPASLPAPKFQNRLDKNSSEPDRGIQRPSSLAAGSSSDDSGSSDGEVLLSRGVRSTTAPPEVASTPSKSPAPAAVPSTKVAAAVSPAPKPCVQPGATVESLLARMLGGAKFN